MCDDYYDLGPMGFSRETRRKARKTHSCEECRNFILAGDHYTHYACLWEGEISTHKLCDFCKRMCRAHSKAERAMGHTGSYQLGTLSFQVLSCAKEEPRYADFFRRAWRGEELPRYAFAAAWRAERSGSTVMDAGP